MRKHPGFRSAWRAGLFGMLLGLAATREAPAAQTLYEDLGADTGVQRITAQAIGLYMADPRLHAYFDNINPEWLKPRFAAYLCHVADGPCVYRGRSMIASHKGLHIDEAAFDATVEDLQKAMRMSGVPFWLQNRLLARLAPLERSIVTR